MYQDNIIQTHYPVILSVIKCPEMKGYSIDHNQQIGWKGITSYWFGWYKYRKDAVESGKSLQEYYDAEYKKINSLK